MRKKVIAGNWKMNMLPNEAIKFISDLAPMVKNAESEVIICAPYTDLFYVLLNAQDTTIKIGAQNVHYEEKGAFTGEISPKMLKCIGTQYVIIGHSERRQYFNEDAEIIAKKAKAALNEGLKPIICVGETLNQREEGKTNEIIKNDINTIFKEINADEMKNVIIAYEPIWAIGTGKTATPDEANDTIKEIREDIKNLYGSDISEEIRILYGGSVKSSNAKELFNMSDIDGGLIGGASLDSDEFSKIVNYNN